MPRCAQKCRSRLHHAGDYESRSIGVLKPRGHYQQIMNENLSVPRVLSRLMHPAAHSLCTVLSCQAQTLQDHAT